MLRTRLTRILLILSPLLLLNCSNNPSSVPLQSDPLLGAPADFSLELIVRPGASVPTDTSHLAPAHILIDPDGSLHYEPMGNPDPGLPPIIRKLSRRQLADLWASLNQSGFANPSAGSPPVNHNLLTPAPDETIQLISISADSRNWEFLQSSRPDQPASQAALDLIDTLVSLAWVNPNNAPGVVILPQRNDFGPDPYARYRHTIPPAAPSSSQASTPKPPSASTPVVAPVIPNPSTSPESSPDITKP